MMKKMSCVRTAVEFPLRQASPPVSAAALRRSLQMRTGALCQSALTLLLPLVSGAVAAASNEVYVCTDSSGARVYQNTGPSDLCRRLNLEPMLSVPQPGGRSYGSAAGQSAGQSARQSAGQSGASAASNPPAFPPAAGASAPPGAGAAQQRVPVLPSREAIQARESDRLRILESELRDEERRLQGLMNRQQTASDETLSQDIARSQASLEALRREIAKVRRP